MTKLYEWWLVIQDFSGKSRRIKLDHEYATMQEAEREAEDIADQEYTDDDIGWSVVRGKKVERSEG